jgi:hypothetical protein
MPIMESAAGELGLLAESLRAQRWGVRYQARTEPVVIDGRNTENTALTTLPATYYSRVVAYVYRKRCPTAGGVADGCQPTRARNRRTRASLTRGFQTCRSEGR